MKEWWDGLPFITEWHTKKLKKKLELSLQYSQKYLKKCQKSGFMKKKLSHIKLMISEKVEELEPKFLLHLVSEIFLTHLDGEIIVECEKNYFEFPPALGALCSG